MQDQTNPSQPQNQKEPATRGIPPQSTKEDTNPPAGPADQLVQKKANARAEVHETGQSAHQRTFKPEEDETWPSCAIDGTNSSLLVVTNWSTLWTVNKLRQHLLKSLGGDELTFSEDGTQAFLSYTTFLAAMQARTVCEQACSLLRSDHTEHAGADAAAEDAHNAQSSQRNNVNAGIDFERESGSTPFEGVAYTHGTDLECLEEPGRELLESSMRSGANLHTLDAHNTWGPISSGSARGGCAPPASGGGFPSQPSSGSSGAGYPSFESHEWCLISC